VTGCIGYRGYFDQADAQAEADRLARFLLEPAGRRHRPRTVWDRLGTLRRHV
jgi:hypothetical protein